MAPGFHPIVTGKSTGPAERPRLTITPRRRRPELPRRESLPRWAASGDLIRESGAGQHSLIQINAAFGARRDAANPHHARCELPALGRYFRASSFPGLALRRIFANQPMCSPSSRRWKSSDMSSSGSFTGDGGEQRVFASQAIWHALFAGSVSAGRCVVTLFLCPALITAVAFITLYTVLWWRWSQRPVAPPLNPGATP
jgi:hypothetical protein